MNRLLIFSRVVDPGYESHWVPFVDYDDFGRALPHNPMPADKALDFVDGRSAAAWRWGTNVEFRAMAPGQVP